MDTIDRISPISPISPTGNLRVAESNKDGGQKPGGKESGPPEPHDVLELHTADLEEAPAEPELTSAPTTIGLDLAV